MLQQLLHGSGIFGGGLQPQEGGCVLQDVFHPGQDLQLQPLHVDFDKIGEGKAKLVQSGHLHSRISGLGELCSTQIARLLNGHLRSPLTRAQGQFKGIYSGGEPILLRIPAEHAVIGRVRLKGIDLCGRPVFCKENGVIADICSDVVNNMKARRPWQIPSLQEAFLIVFAGAFDSFKYILTGIPMQGLAVLEQHRFRTKLIHSSSNQFMILIYVRYIRTVFRNEEMS